MRLALNLFFFILTLVMLADESFSLTNYQIKNICKKEKRESICFKNLKEKKTTLEKGGKIEIQVIPYER